MMYFGRTHPVLGMFDCPGQGFAERFTRDAATGLADGHQACVIPIQGAVVPQLTHESGVHQHDEVHVPGLAHPVAELTIAHAQVLLPVPIIGLGSGPTSLVDLQNAVGFPMGSVRHQHFAWLLGVGLRPEEQQAHRMIHLRDAHRCGEIPWRMAADGKLRAHERPERLEPRTHRRLRSADDDRAVERQVTDVGALGAVDVIHDRCVGEVTVAGEITGDGLGDHPINQFRGQIGVILEWTCVITLFPLAEASEIKGIVLATRVDVVGKEIVMGHNMPLVGMIPEAPHIGDQFAIVVDQGIVQGNDAILPVPGGRIVLEPFETVGVDPGHIPDRLRDPAVQAGLVRRIREFACDAADRLVFDNQKAGHVFGEVDTCGFIGKVIPKLN